MSISIAVKPYHYVPIGGTFVSINGKFTLSLATTPPAGSKYSYVILINGVQDSSGSGDFLTKSKIISFTVIRENPSLVEYELTVNYTIFSEDNIPIDQGTSTETITVRRLVAKPAWNDQSTIFKIVEGSPHVTWNNSAISVNEDWFKNFETGCYAIGGEYSKSSVGNYTAKLTCTSGHWFDSTDDDNGNVEEYTWYIDKKKLTISILQSGFVWRQMAVDYEDTDTTPVLSNCVYDDAFGILQYCINSESGPYENYDEEDGCILKNSDVGKYKLYFKVIPKQEYQNSCTESDVRSPGSIDKYEIKEHPVNPPAIDPNKPVFYYDGDTHPDSILYDSDRCNVDPKSTTEPKSDTGNYFIKCTLKNTTNYVWSTTGPDERIVEWKIDNKIAIQDPTFEGEYIYNEEPQNVVIDYHGYEEYINTTGTLSGTNAGSYEVVFTIKDEYYQNPYVWENSETQSITRYWEIQKAIQPWSVSTDQLHRYCGESGSISPADLDKIKEDATLKFDFNSTYISASLTPDLKVNITGNNTTDDTSSGTSNLKLYTEETDNYEKKSFIIPVRVERNSQSWKVTPTTLGIPLGGSGTANVSGSVLGGSLRWSKTSGGSIDVNIQGSKITFTTTSSSTPGTIKGSLVSDETSRYYSKSVAITINVSEKYNYTVIPPDFLSDAKYTGLDQQLITSLDNFHINDKDGVDVQASIDDIQFGLSTIPDEEPETYIAKDDFATIVGKNAGSYYIWLKFSAHTTTYDDYKQAISNIEIAKATQRISKKPIPVKNVVTTGYPIALCSAGKSTGVNGETGGSILYGLDQTSLTEQIPTAVVKGTYTIYYKASGTDNYEETTISSIVATLIDRYSTIKIWDGSTWKSVYPVVWDGTQWKQAVAKVFTGSEWKDLNKNA